MNLRRVASRSFRTIQKVFSPFRAQCAVLLYHRVANLEGESARLAVSPENFEKHLRILAESYKVLSLNQMVEALQKRELPHRSVVITFDDGYADLLHFAKPILEKVGLPATMYITTGYLDQKKEFWWDDLERILLLSQKLPDSLTLNLKSEELQFETSSLDQRKTVLNELLWKIKALNQSEIEKIFEKLWKWAGISSEGRKENRALTTSELQELASAPGIEIGAHTQNHLSLAMQTSEIQENEILKSKQHLESLLNKPINTFAYPFGLPEEHYTQKTVQIVSKCGLQNACSTARSTVSKGFSRIFEIPRFSMLDCSATEFKRKLAALF